MNRGVRTRKDYPMLVPEGKLRGYWLIAPGVYQPPCGFTMTSGGWACRLPRGHDGTHHMERDEDDNVTSGPRISIQALRSRRRRVATAALILGPVATGWFAAWQSMSVIDVMVLVGLEGLAFIAGTAVAALARFDFGEDA